MYKKQNKTVGWEILGVVYEMMSHFVFTQFGVFMSPYHHAIHPSDLTWYLFTKQCDTDRTGL